MKSSKIKLLTKEELKELFFKNALVFIGSILLAFGVACFITKLSIVSGGLSGIAIIVQSFFPDVQIVDIVVAILTVVCWVIGVITLGRRFIIRTTLASVIYSGMLFVFLRVPFFINIADQVAGDGSAGNILICAIFYGVFSGAGVALTFLGGGSTGGVDVFIFLIARKFRLKESVVSFLIDAVIVLLSIILIKDNFLNSACGIIAAFVAALVIEYVYVGNQTSYQADIISSHWEEISKYAQDVLGRGATIIPVKGGYKLEERVMLRVVIEKRQYEKLRKYIAKVDPKAFVTYTLTLAVYGEGFKNH